MATTFGTAHLYGVSGTITNATVVSTDISRAHANQGATVDEQGNAIERRYDDLTRTGTLTIKIQSGYTIPTAASTLAYDSVTYEITDVGEAQEAQGFRQVTLSVLQSTNITYS